MAKILRIKTSGIKNIDKEISFLFCNKITDDGIKKFSKVKGIFGYNGSGKTAFITSVDIYRNIVLDSTYLIQNANTKILDELINKKSKVFWFELVAQHKENGPIFKHYISIKFNKASLSYIIKEERLYVCRGRSFDENCELIASRDVDNNLSINNKYSEDSVETIKYLKEKLSPAASFAFCSVVNLLAREKKESKTIKIKNNSLLDYFLNLFFCVFAVKVHMSSSDKHELFLTKADAMMKEIKMLMPSKEDINRANIYVKPHVIKRKDLEKYKLQNRKMCKFLQLFKPELLDIKTETKEYEENYVVRDIFVYKDFLIDSEFESTGIKNLMDIFGILDSCANGSIAFIDEMDASINSVYLCKLIEFFLNYGKGQLCFTSHDLLAMDTLKKQGKSIDVIGEDLNVETWVGTGNASPRSSYQNGYFINSPMNIQDFDFVSIFFGEEGSSKKCK